MKISELQHVAHDMAVGKGWWPYPVNPTGQGFRLEPDTIAAKLALVHSETSEALEEVRDGNLEAWYDGDRVNGNGMAKPEGLPAELADIVIRVADLAGAMGIDLELAVDEKLRYNMGRVHRHGGRAL